MFSRVQFSMCSQLQTPTLLLDPVFCPPSKFLATLLIIINVLTYCSLAADQTTARECLNEYIGCTFMPPLTHR